tara:strand:- start:1337 stop:1927 length:591 start_codon:yes stop_codon:yes gene_type:complete
MQIIRNIICLIALIVISPLLFFSALLIILEDGLPIFFTQERIGLNKKAFTMYKMRTMKKNAPQLATHEVKPNFLLATGNLIRALKLDEFPQLLNVVLGHLNLVGPRPSLAVQTLLIRERESRYIFTIKPGITGLAQILGYDMSDPKKLSEVDMIYMKNKTMSLDFLILLGTFFTNVRNIVSIRIGVPFNQNKSNDV